MFATVEVNQPVDIPRWISKAAGMAAWIGWALCSTAIAQNEIRIEGVRIGIQNAIKVGCWTPCEVRLSGPAGVLVDVQVTAADPDGNPMRFPMQTVTLQSGETPVRSMVRSGRLGGAIRIEVFRDKVIADRRLLSPDSGSLQPLTPDAQFWLVAGDVPAVAKAAARWNEVRPQGAYVQSLADMIPATTALALEGVNAVVIQAATPIAPQTSELLKTWVQRGGRLVVIVGDDVDPLRRSPLASWLPVLPEQTDELRELGNLAALVSGSSALRVRAALTAARFSVAPSDGQVLASSLAGPLVHRSAYGTGTVTMVGVDLRDRPLSNWDDELSLMELMTVLIPVVPPWRTADGRGQPITGSAEQLNPTGVSDLQTQLLDSVDHFDEVHRVTQWWVLAWIGGLVLLLGPLDYFLVHRILQRPHWTWITFPIWAGIVSVWSLQAGTAANQSTMRSRQIDLIDMDLTVNTVRGCSWFSFYSPDTRRYAVSMKPGWENFAQQSITGTSLGWARRPEESFRGMYRRGGLDLTKPEYSLTPAMDTIENLPVRVWSTGVLEGHWESSGFEPDTWAKSTLFDDGSTRLTGKFVHHLPGELTDWLIAYKSFAYFKGSAAGNRQAGDALSPDEVFDVASGSSNILRGYLIGLTFGVQRAKKQKDDVIVSDRSHYDPMMRDPFQILRTLTFHDVTGGAEYTGLRNQPLATMELSQLVNLNRAVLFGRLDLRATRFSVDGASPESEQQDTFVRIILPVNRHERNLSAPPPSDLLEPKK